MLTGLRIIVNSSDITGTNPTNHKFTIAGESQVITTAIGIDMMMPCIRKDGKFMALLINSTKILLDPDYPDQCSES